MRLNPDDAKVQTSLGDLLASLGRTQEAIEHLEAAERLRPDPSTAARLERLRAKQ